MASIKYAHIINSFVSTEGSGGIMTNYVYYSVLVVENDGSRRLVEGKYSDILWLIPYIRTPLDELDELEKIKATVNEIKQDLNSIVDQKADYIIDSLYPIPDIIGKNEDEAQVILKNAGFIPVMARNYPASVPHHGIVRSCTRSNKNFKEIILDIIHEIPDVVGKPEAEADNLLAVEGFEISKAHTFVSNARTGTVISCTRPSDTSMSVNMEISIMVPEILGMPVEQAINMLKQENINFITETEYMDNVEDGKVATWTESGLKQIKLTVSAGKKIRTTPVIAASAWDNMLGSSGDHYSAKISCNRDSDLISITLFFNIQAKLKHSFNSLSVRCAGKEESISVPETVMNPGESGKIEFTIHNPVGIYALPKQIDIVIPTKYGPLKKEEVISLSLKPKW